jgi:hypothetical protein
MSKDTTEQTASQRHSAELAAAAFANPELRDRFVLMAKESEARVPVRDDFAWLSPDAKPQTGFERFESFARRLISVPKHEIDEQKAKTRKP